MSITVIIPVYNSASLLSETLRALSEGSRQPDELLVIDDGSTDDSAAVAAQMGARVLAMPQNAGPSACRNFAALQTSGSLLIFLDADTQVHADTLAQLESRLEKNPELSAVIGAYDDAPSDPGWISQYRNLSHCYVHRSSRPRALTFWSGCGAIRRVAFFDAGGFDERFHRPSVEDIELGYRMVGQGKQILLDPNITVKHAKRWTLRNSIVTDIRDRGIPWMTLLLERHQIPDDLNVSTKNRISSGLVALSLACCIAARISTWWLAAAVALTFIALSLHVGLFRFIVAHKGLAFLPRACALFVLVELSNLVSVVGGLLAWFGGSRRGTRISRVQVVVTEHRTNG